MAAGFNTQTGGGKYRLQFETDNEEYFLLMQELARCCVDHPKVKTNADRIRAMTDEELAKFIPNWSYTDACKCVEKPYVDCNNECEKCVSEWLQQPAEDL